MKKNRPLTYISLFSSAGIGCYGFKESGFACLATVELLEKRLKIQKINDICNTDDGYINGDIAEQKIKDQIIQTTLIGLKKLKQNKLDVLIATPPCQGMSVANHKKGNELPRNSLVIESISLVKKLEPKYFVFENVPSFLKTSCLDLDKNHKTIEEAIKTNLQEKYKIESRKINFSEYGSNSSRTRCLVIGVNRNHSKTNPFDLFPEKEESKTLREVIGDLPNLDWGQIDKKDIFHSFRTYKLEMREWISSIKEGESAFDNTDKLKRPHAIKDGKFIEHKRGNGDKYKRQVWDKVAPCVHTRNDILASQNTVHPKEDRVFSIRELMKMMTIPDSFKFSECTRRRLNELLVEEKIKFLKTEELNIRHCIGEAVPTKIFFKIAEKIKHKIMCSDITIESKFINFQKQTKITDQIELAKFIQKNGFKNYSLSDFQSFAEILNTSKEEHAAYYTDPDIVHEIVENLPEFSDKKTISILEPSVGSGSFIPELIHKYRNKKIIIDVIDINKDTLKVLEAILTKLDVKNAKINYLNENFLFSKFTKKYDLVIGNPPFLKINRSYPNYDLYKANARNNKTSNLFIFFLERAVEIGNYVCLIIPKSFLGSPEFNSTRSEISNFSFHQIHDFGESGFKGVLIETIALGFYTKNRYKNKVKIISRPLGKHFYQNQNYIFSKNFPTWLIYRNDDFDKVADTMRFGAFDVFRDRQITSKILLKKGAYRVLKSANIGNCKIINTERDLYVDEINNLVVSKFLNVPNLVLVPNLSYLPRACIKPKGTLVDGSSAILIRKDGKKTSINELKFFSSDKFRNFYKICRNFSSRSMNIDSNHVFYFGLKDGY